MPKQVKQEDDTPKYQQPRPELGQTVLWYDDLSQASVYPAIVTQVGNEGVSLFVLAPGYQDGYVREGVRHIGHPDKEIIRNSGVGVWDFRAADRQLAERLVRLEEVLAVYQHH